MQTLFNINTLSKGIGGLTSAYATYQIAKIGHHIATSKHKTKALQSNLIPLIHATLGASLGSVGAGLADLSLASGGALHLLSQNVTNKFFDLQNDERQKDVSEAVKRLQKNVFIGSCCITSAFSETKYTDAEKIKIFKDLSIKRLNAYIQSLNQDTDKEAKITQAKQIFNKLDYSAKNLSEEAIQTSKLTPDEKNIYNQIKTDFPDSGFNTHISSEQLSHIQGESYTAIYTPSTQAIPVTGDIINIIKLNENVNFNDVPLGSKITSQYGAYLNENDTITIDNTNTNGQGSSPVKKGDKIYKNSLIKTTDGCTYVVQIAPDEATAETNHFLYKNNALENIQQQQNHFHWDLPTMLASASLLALMGTVALGTPMLSSEMKLDTLNTLGKTIKWGAAFAGALMPCGINAANMRGHIAHNLQKQKNIIIKTPELLDNLADMKIDKEKDSDYHFLVDFNGTLTKGSEFVALKFPTPLAQDNHVESNNNLSKLMANFLSFCKQQQPKKESLASSKEVDNEKLLEILQPIVAMGDTKNSTHHIHKALKEKLKDKPEIQLDSTKIISLEGMGTYYRDDKNKNQQYAIGNEALIKEFLKDLSEDKQKAFNIKFDTLKNQKSENAVTYIIHNDDMYALETTHKLRDDAKAFLEQHKGHFTVLTGAKLSDTVKNNLGLSKDNCYEELKPEGKKEYAENLRIKGKRIPKEKIVAFGDGGNDWGMFHTVNVATQLTDIHDTSHKDTMNLANVFSDVIIPELSDFDILNNIAKKQKTPQGILNGLGLLDIAYGASMVLSHTHHHNPLHHTIHHLLSIGIFYGLGSVISKNLVNQQIKQTDTESKA